MLCARPVVAQASVAAAASAPIHRLVFIGCSGAIGKNLPNPLPLNQRRASVNSAEN
jgi:hypothetical protein